MLPPAIVEAVVAAVEAGELSADAPAAVAVVGEDGIPLPAPPPKEPSPFELKKHFPPDGAEVPFVASHEAPGAPASEPSPAPEEKAPTPAPVEEAPAAEEPAAEEAAPAAEEAAAPAEE